jgi:formylglycine-generating enzyme required for sulfatase activity
MNMIEMIPLPPGRFQMGSTRGLPLEVPVREVTIRHGFSMAIHPVTQAQWEVVMGRNPAGFPLGGDFPVENVSWEDAQAFCARLQEQDGRRFRLPTEAEWEYACRAGSTTEFHFGDDEGELKDYAWFERNSGRQPNKVGQKRPNAWGLHDMPGTVWEWCEDVWHSDYEGAPVDGSGWMERETQQPRRCLRGGSWNYDAFRCRSAYRSRDWKNFRTDHFGFRVVVDGLCPTN